MRMSLPLPSRTREEMTGALVCMHGYTADSPEIADLLDILCDDFTPQQQQLFLVFLTGSPRLPPGLSPNRQLTHHASPALFQFTKIFFVFDMILQFDLKRSLIPQM